MDGRRKLPVLNPGHRSGLIADPLPPRPPEFGAAGFAPLTDAQGRTYSYLRLSLTDRCNFGCVYCMPPSGETEHARRPELLTFEESATLVTALSQASIRRVRLTGGEPLVRKDVVRLIELIRREATLSELVMTTNGARLPELAHPLRQAGLDGVNVSIDSLQADRFRAITRGGELGPVLAGINAALDADLEVKVNIVALGGYNDDELHELVTWAWDLGITPRFIELMPIGEASNLGPDRLLSANEIRSRLGALLSAEPEEADDKIRGPAQYYGASDGSLRRVGFITALSDEFCGSCNRIRVTAMGKLRSCLADRRAVSLRDILRCGGDTADLVWAVQWALRGKKDGHGFHDPTVEEYRHVGMSLIGG